MPEPDWLDAPVRWRFAEMPDDVAAVGGDVYPVWEAATAGMAH